MIKLLINSQNQNSTNSLASACSALKSATKNNCYAEDLHCNKSAVNHQIAIQVYFAIKECVLLQLSMGKVAQNTRRVDI
jgi:hypothetical protein